MKHYEIKKWKNGWISATVICRDGSKETYNCFFSIEEAKKWCWAKIAYQYGRKIANSEIDM